MIPNFKDGFQATSPVGSFPPNELGLHDLGGNVREWVSDFYINEAQGFGTTRGGSWLDYREEHLRTSFRRPMSDTGEGYGFRVVLAKLNQSDEVFIEEEEDDG